MIDIKRKILIALIGFPILFIGFSFFILYPFYEKIDGSSNKLILIEKELSYLTERSRKLFLWEKEEPLLEPEISQVKDVFINAKLPVTFLRFLEKAALESNLEIKVSLLRQPEDEPEMDWRISLIGSFPSIMKFINIMEDASYSISIESFGVSGPDQDQIIEDSFRELEFNLAIKTLALP